MPRSCTTCKSPKREAINQALIAGESSVCAIAKRYGIPEQSLRQHRDRHLKAAVQAAVDDRELRLRDKIVEHVEDLSKRIDYFQGITCEVLQESHVEGVPVFSEETGLPLLEKSIDKETGQEIFKPLRRRDHGLTLDAIAEGRKNVDSQNKIAEHLSKLTGQAQPETLVQLGPTFEQFQAFYFELKSKGLCD